MSLASRVVKQAVREWRHGCRSLHSKTIAPAQRRPVLAALVSGGVVLGVYAGYTSLSPVQLDTPASRKKKTKQSPNAPKYISYEEVQKHNTPESCWVIIDGQVYDATSVLRWHPAGPNVILKHSGQDATKAFVPAHPPNILSHLPPEAHLGPVDPETMPKERVELTPDEIRVAEARKALPPPSAALNLYDIEQFAEKVMTATAWAYYRSTADDENTYWENSDAYRRFWFRPRVLRKISHISTATTMVGLPTSLPIYISPSALARLGHPDGEMNMVRAAGEAGITQGISHHASCSTEEIMSVKSSQQDLMYQMYMPKDRNAAKDLIKKAERAGYKALILTVDTAVTGKRELDMRLKQSSMNVAVATGKATVDGLGIAHSIGFAKDPDVCWDDIPWIRSVTRLPLIIKGIQSVEDAELALDKYKVDAIVLSNHGGRQLDYAPAPLTVLHELHERRPDLLRKHEVYIDGGIRRGTDVLKALCLGARAVGLGRPFLYANGVWGEEGCRRVIQILREEIETGMRLLGVTSVDQLTPDLIRYVDRDPGPRRRS
ncbi:hypothetical protein CERSUDRAFT_91590 [Gelatoporia subvermispora B]|uniref:L-lactate dehydrogenase (cytochrome) n=1 Tax=Ceriporiopsis subvermispora (strain B) TaxID=914234 RepID=M2PVP4_CERS8|nr:hypothetical protein CERSUDRAFT_91590 [Gelatoporia subvermispora B]